MSPPHTSLFCLPALSVVLGMPLCRDAAVRSSDLVVGPSTLTVGEVGDKDTSGRDDDNVGRAASPAAANAASTSSSSRRRKHHDEWSRRVKDNVSRMYARRVIDGARLEREHPWASSSSRGGVASREECVNDDGNGSVIGGRGASSRRDGLSRTKRENKTCWKDELLSETLLSLIKLQDRMDRIRALSDGYSGKNTGGGVLNALFDGMNIGANNNNLLDRLGINDKHDRFLHILANGRMSNNVAHCESVSQMATSSKQRTLDDYNTLSHASSAADDDGSKPAEWSDRIDLEKRRREFGREISPLSDTSRLERWRMALGRMIKLGCLVAPLGALVPANLVLGRLAGKPAKKTKAEVSESDIVLAGQDASTSSTAKTEPAEDDKHLSRLQRRHRELTRLTWDYALWAVETAGPTYIKLVQWASTRNDLFSPEFVGHFSKLQDETRGHSWRETEATLVRAYGKDWRGVLSFNKEVEDVEDGDDDEGGLKGRGGRANSERQKRLLDLTETMSTTKGGGGASGGPVPTVPIGSGCVAQVYKARLTRHHGLHPPGTSVAVKVQHPRILEKVCLDFYIFNKLASMLEHIPYLNLDYLSMKDTVDQFRDIMLPQLDLRVEAHNLRRFRRDFEGETTIAFPEPLVGLTSREVLVERFVEGEPMLNYVKKEDELHSKMDREELARIGLETVMKMIFLHDFIHADLHPGNMIVDHNKSARGSPLRVHMIDCGLTVELGERDHMNLVKILGSLIKRDGHAAGKLMVDTAKKCQATELDVEMFCKGIEKICVDDEDNNFLESVGDYLTDICYLACKHKVKLEAAFINAALACEIMEGLASSLYPDMQVQSVALPMVLKAEMMHGLKGLPSPRLWGLNK